MNLRQFVLVVLGAAAVAVVIQCGGSSSSPTNQPTPPPTTTTTTLPSSGLPPGMVCNPTPPSVRYVKVGVFNDSGFRKQLDSKPQVNNLDGYCGKVGFDPRAPFCDTRPEGDPQRVACDYLASGKAKDTGLWGPTWFYEGKPCAADGPDESGCKNNSSNQFMVIAKGNGEFAACVYPPDGDKVCGVCNIVGGGGKCQ